MPTRSRGSVRAGSHPMKLQEQDYYHGAALTQLVESTGFTALNKASDRYGHYLVNHDRRMFVKYRSNGTSRWQFGFTQPEIRAIRDDHKGQKGKTFVVLVCGPETICPLTRDELFSVIDQNATGQQAMRVEFKQGQSMRVTGPLGRLKGTIPHNAFPRKILA